MAASRTSTPTRPASPASPRRRRAAWLADGRALPSGRLLLVGFGLLALAAGGYAGARETSVFAVRQIEVQGPRPLVVHRVETALESLAGASLLSVDGAAIDRRLAALPDVRLVSYDRAFPHTARIVVAAERPVAVLRSGSKAWLVSEQGRVLRSLSQHPRSELPRIWVSEPAVLSDGALLPDEQALRPALALGQILSADERFLGHVREARLVDGELRLVLAAGAEVRLGAEGDVALKIEIARQILRLLGPGGARYVDVSVPERPVALPNSKVGG